MPRVFWAIWSRAIGAGHDSGRFTGEGLPRNTARRDRRCQCDEKMGAHAMSPLLVHAACAAGLQPWRQLGEPLGQLRGGGSFFSAPGVRARTNSAGATPGSIAAGRSNSPCGVPGRRWLGRRKYLARLDRDPAITRLFGQLRGIQRLGNETQHEPPPAAGMTLYGRCCASTEHSVAERSRCTAARATRNSAAWPSEKQRESTLILGEAGGAASAAPGRAVRRSAGGADHIAIFQPCARCLGTGCRRR